MIAFFSLQIYTRLRHAQIAQMKFVKVFWILSVIGWLAALIPKKVLCSFNRIFLPSQNSVLSSACSFPFLA